MDWPEELITGKTTGYLFMASSTCSINKRLRTFEGKLLGNAAFERSRTPDDSNFIALMED